MRKQSGQLIILLLVLAALAAAFLGLRQYNKVQGEKTDEEPAETIFDARKEEVVRFTYDYNGESYTFEKKDDIWYYAEDSSLNIKQYQISNMLAKVAPLQAEMKIENVTDMTQYGFGESNRMIQYETEQESYLFEAGDYNAVSDVYYIRKPSEDVVYAVSAATVTIFDKLPEELAESSESEEDTETH